MDRRILGLDTTTKDKVKDEVTGLLYALKSIWDFPFQRLSAPSPGRGWSQAAELLRACVEDVDPQKRGEARGGLDSQAADHQS